MKRIPLIIFSTILILIPLASLAAGLVPCGGDGEPRCQLCHFFVLFKNVVDFLLTKIIPPLAILMLAIGGFMYVFAYLSPSQALGGGSGGPALLSQAKQLIISVIFGLLIIFAAWLIVNFFFQMIGVADWTGLKAGWWKIDCPTTTSQSQSQTGTINTTDLKSVLAKANTDYFSNPGKSVLSKEELRDLTDLYSSSSAGAADLSKTGSFSGEKLADIYNKANGIDSNSLGQSSASERLLSGMQQSQEFSSGAAKNNIGFMSNLANALDFNRGLVAANQGVPLSSSGSSVSPEVSIADIDERTQTGDGTTIVSGRTADGLRAVSMTRDNVTVISATNATGDLVKMSIIDQLGNVQNLTGSFNKDGSVFLTANGTQNFSGNISAGNFANITIAMSSLTGQRSDIRNLFGTGYSLSQGNVNSLFQAAMGFEDAMFIGLTNPSQSIINSAQMHNMSAAQMSSLYNNIILGNMDFIASQSAGGSFASPSALSSVYSQVIGEAIDISSLTGSSQGFMQNSISAFQNLMNSGSYGNMLNTPQGQEVLYAIQEVQISAHNSADGTPDPALVDRAMTEFNDLTMEPEYQEVINSSEMSNTINNSVPADQVYDDFWGTIDDSGEVTNPWYNAAPGTTDIMPNVQILDPEAQFSLDPYSPFYNPEQWTIEVESKPVTMPIVEEVQPGAIYSDINGQWEVSYPEQVEEDVYNYCWPDCESVYDSGNTENYDYSTGNTDYYNDYSDYSDYGSQTDYGNESYDYSDGGW